MTKDEALNHALQLVSNLRTHSWTVADTQFVITAIKEALAQTEQKPMHPQLKAMLEDYFDKCFAESKPKEPQCNPHPKAPHGLARESSYNSARYVCECEGWDAYEAGKQDGIQSMLHLGYGDNPNPLTATEIVDCATAVYQCDPNDVTENDIKFARHIERMTLER